MDTKILMNRMFPPLRPLSRPVNIAKEEIKKVLYLPDIFSPTMKSGSYQDFMYQLKKIYGDISIKEFLSRVKKSSNFMNSGRESKVYAIPGIENYVIKESCKTKIKDFKEVKNSFYGHNFGQPIAENGNGLEILLKNEGEPLSVKNWADYYCGAKKITQKDAKKFLQMLEEISSFPQESFDDLVKRIKFICTKLHKSIDSVNPNNFLIDKKNKHINIVDLGVLPHGSAPLQDSTYTLVNPLTDKCLSYDYMNVFNENERVLYIDFVEIIKQKCKKAYEKHFRH